LKAKDAAIASANIPAKINLLIFIIFVFFYRINNAYSYQVFRLPPIIAQ